MAFGKSITHGFSNPSEIFANILKLIGPNAKIVGPGFIFNRDGLFFYSGLTPALGNLIISLTNGLGSGFDPKGNAYVEGVTAYFPTVNPLLAVGLSSAGALQFYNAATPNGGWNATGTATDDGTGNIVIQALINKTIELISPVSITQRTSIVDGGAIGEALFVHESGNNAHAITAKYDGTGLSQSALNVVSSNPNFSASEVAGAETNRGTYKVTHQGYADGSDVDASAISIDLQTVTGGATGTKARALFITSTTDTLPAGDIVTMRLNGQDYFVIKGNNSPSGSGIVGIGIPVGHLPSGMLEIAQKDVATAGLSMTAIALGTDMLRLKASGGASRVIVDNGGHLIIGASAAASVADLELHDLLAIHQSAAPANPPAGYFYVWMDSTTHDLRAKSPAGTVTVIGNP